METRLKVSVFVAGGLGSARPIPEVDPVNFAPRVKIPTLMLNGRYDFIFPLETSQRPMYGFLDSSDKKHILYETGHVVPFDQCAKEILAWLDKYLGPVKK